MAYFKKLGLYAAPMMLAAVSTTAMTGCDGESPGEALCGPCGVVAEGDVGISGNAKLDGFFAAVSQLNTGVLTASADFEVGIDNLIAAFGTEVAADADLEAKVDAVLLDIRGEISANASGGLMVNIAPAQCSANVDVAFSAQAQCEAKAGCEADVDPGSVEVTCEGSCSGECSGSCEVEAEAMCEVSAGGIECSGMCEGSCELEAAATCEGTCKGECSGSCSAHNANGSCAGTCDGECTGTCELSAAAECSGSCTGSCTAEAPSGGCEAEATAKCDGKCEGSCSGGCEGEATPPSASVDCEASAECEAQASAQGSASIECTPPSVEISFELDAGVDAQASAEFSAKMAALRANAGVIVQSFNQYQVLLTGEVNGEVAFETKPIDAVTLALQGVIDAGVSGDLFADIPAGRIDCVIPAMSASVTMLTDIAGEAKGTIGAQVTFMTAFAGGFSS